MKLPDTIDRLRIVFYPAPVLRQRCQPVVDFDRQLDQLIQRMIHLLREAPGVGLAGPQVGVPARIFVCNHTGEPDDTAVWINPVLSDLRGSVEGEEGCLSLPGINIPKRRAQHAVISACDVTGQPIRAEADDLRARIWQHETDHLDGVLIIDNMSEAAELACRRTIQQLETDFRAPKKRRRPFTTAGH